MRKADGPTLPPGAAPGRRQQRRDRRRRVRRHGGAAALRGYRQLAPSRPSRSVTVGCRPARPGTRWSPRRSPRGWSGLECLSGIPGSAGATPIQNVGAYGQEVAETITAVRAYDRGAARSSRCRPAECGFGYRTSVFKHNDRYVVLSVDFRLTVSPLSAPDRATPSWPAPSASAVGDRAPLARGTRGGTGSARRQGHGARPGRPRHLLGRARSSPTRCSTPPASSALRDAPPSRARRRPGPARTARSRSAPPG